MPDRHWVSMRAIFVAILLSLVPIHSAKAETVIVGSKKFTESVILGEIVAQLGRNEGVPIVHQRDLGGTRILWNALLSGEIDIYPDYTGTIQYETLAKLKLSTIDAVRKALAQKGVLMSNPLGFNNTYAIGMTEAVAGSLGISKISDLMHYPKLKFVFGNEFMDRSDGWPGLRDRYGLGQNPVRGMDHDLAYRGLMANTIQVMDLYATDAEIDYYHLRVLEDDRHYFPNYQAVWLYRADLVERAPAVIAALKLLEGRIEEDAMIQMNAKAKIDKIPEGQIAVDFLRENLDIRMESNEKGAIEQLWVYTLEHLLLVSISLSSAVLVSIPLGILSARRPRAGQLVLGMAGLIQTIPSLALLVFMIPLLGIGGPPAIVALFLYSLLPIIRNTYTGLKDIPSQLLESAEALGLPPAARLLHIELPLASRTILAGIKTSAVINVGTATLGALIGAGGYGQPILTGIRLDNFSLILQGAVPAALLALAVQGIFELAELYFVPKGLRLKNP